MKPDITMREKLILIALGLALAACSEDNGKREEIQKAIAYLKNDPTASSTDGMTFGDPNYWHIECRAGSALWKAAETTCNEGGQHPQVCEIIRNAGNVCP